jgi:endoglucanase
MLSHNLPWLTTSGNRILRPDGAPVLLRGVNRSGLEYSEPSAEGFLAAARFSEDEVRNIVQGWRSNIIRVPFNQDWALRGRRDHSAESYLAALDQVISWAAGMGAYTILDLQWLDADTVYGINSDGTPNRVAPTPNADTIVLWRTMAKRYRDEPAVLFDLFNEPHDPLGDDFLPLWVPGPDGEIVELEDSFVGPDEWNSWAELLVAEIRATRPNGLMLIAGIDWAFDLRKVRVDAPNIVYSAHIYPNRKPKDWRKALGRSRDVPVFVGEWGGTNDDIAFGRDLAARMQQDALGWTAWSWSDYPHLVQDLQPTVFGEFVRSQLQA